MQWLINQLFLSVNFHLSIINISFIWQISRNSLIHCHINNSHSQDGCKGVKPKINTQKVSFSPCQNIFSPKMFFFSTRNLKMFSMNYVKMSQFFLLSFFISFYCFLVVFGHFTKQKANQAWKNNLLNCLSIISMVLGRSFWTFDIRFCVWFFFVIFI